MKKPQGWEPQVHLMSDTEVNLRLNSLFNVEDPEIVEFCSSWSHIEHYIFKHLRREGLLEYFIGTYPMDHTSPQGAARALIVIMYGL